MKIKKLWISEYKNIKDTTLNFESDLVTLLVGRNGLGKSNLIEILALIFRELELIDIRQEFLDWPYKTGHFEFRIKYECKNSEMRIQCFNDKGEDVFYIQRRDKGSDLDYETIPFAEFKKRRKEEFLPDYIIGYYSGENKRIRNIIRPFEENVWETLKKNVDSDQGFRSMFFAENHHAQLVLLTVLLYRSNPPSPEFLERLDRLIKEFTSFSSLENFLIHLKQPIWYNRSSKKHRVRSIEKIVENLLPKKTSEEEVHNPFWNAKGKAHKVISFFYDISPDEPTAYYDEKEGQEYLIIDLDKNIVSKKVSDEFEHPANFLDALDSLYVIDSIHHIQLKVRSEKRDTSFVFQAMSEGEQQLVTVLGLILLTGRQDCLFLLDEPDTHLNPAWQRKYVELLTEFNLNDDNSHIIVATHSPLLVQAATNADIFLFKEGNYGVEVFREDFKIRNWRIDHVLLSKFFDLPSTRPKLLDPFMKEREELLSKPELGPEDLKRLSQLEQEYGVLPTGETINDFLAMHNIHSVSQRLSNSDKNREG